MSTKLNGTPIATPAYNWKPQVALFQGARWKEVAKKIGAFAVLTFLIVGTVACLLFIPGAPLVFAGTAVLLLFHLLTGATAVTAAVCLPVLTFVGLNAGYAMGAICGEKLRHEVELLKKRERHKTKNAQPQSFDRVADQFPKKVDPNDCSVHRAKEKDKKQSNSNPSQVTTYCSPNYEPTPLEKPDFMNFKPYSTVSPLLQIEIEPKAAEAAADNKATKPKYPSSQDTAGSSGSSPPTPPRRLSEEDLNPPANSEDEYVVFKKEDDKKPTKDLFNNETIQYSDEEERFEKIDKVSSSPKMYGKLAPKTPPDPNSYRSSPE